MPDPNGTPDKSKWEEAGFADEAAMLEAAKSAADLRSQIAKAEDDLKKEREAKSKTDSQFMKQAQEIGDLRKKLKEVEKPPETTPKETEVKSTDEVLESVSDEEETALLAVLNDPKNEALKKAVAVGGDKAKAEFVKNYRLNAPVAPPVLTLKKRKPDAVSESLIAAEVKKLFKQHNDTEKNNLAVTPSGGTLPDKSAKTTQPKLVGGAPASFFAKKE